MVEAPNPASDVAGETVAALASSSMAFRSSDPGYSDTLLRTAIRAFGFADTYRGAYSDNANVRNGACPFYCDFDGHQLWYWPVEMVHLVACFKALCLIKILQIQQFRLSNRKRYTRREIPKIVEEATFASTTFYYIRC